ncbi:MAG TPA: helix-turn-helix domain-containing protein [Gemmatimonadales bacterium]|nr:helix-turn-helix domain-containing protein [Gemmatimonadales bacterium]
MSNNVILAPLSVRRQQLGMSQSEVASLSGLTQVTISLMERGLGNPRLSSLQEASRVLGMDLRVIPRELIAYVDDLLRSATQRGAVNGEEERPLYALVGEVDDEEEDGGVEGVEHEEEDDDDQHQDHEVL